jgi:hypothetical protein
MAHFIKDFDLAGFIPLKVLTFLLIFITENIKKITALSFANEEGYFKLAHFNFLLFIMFIVKFKSVDI